MRIGAIPGVAIGIVVLVGLLSFPGCSGDGGSVVPASGQRRDEIQKSRELSKAGAPPSAKRPGAR